jgi:hypothetical protein
VLFSLVILFSIFLFGNYSRDESKLKDVYAIAEAVPEGTTFGTPRNTWADFVLVAYMNRIGNFSLDCDHECEFYLIEKESDIGKQLGEKYSVIDLKLEKYIILRKKQW